MKKTGDLISDHNERVEALIIREGGEGLIRGLGFILMIDFGPLEARNVVVPRKYSGDGFLIGFRF